MDIFVAAALNVILRISLKPWAKISKGLVNTSKLPSESVVRSHCKCITL